MISELIKSSWTVSCISIILMTFLRVAVGYIQLQHCFISFAHNISLSLSHTHTHTHTRARARGWKCHCRFSPLIRRNNLAMLCDGHLLCSLICFSLVHISYCNGHDSFTIQHTYDPFNLFFTSKPFDFSRMVPLCHFVLLIQCESNVVCS